MDTCKEHVRGTSSALCVRACLLACGAACELRAGLPLPAWGVGTDPGPTPPARERAGR